MTYEVRYTSIAQEQFAALPFPLVGEVYQAYKKKNKELATSPTSVSDPPRKEFVLDSQSYDFSFSAGGYRYRFVLSFKFSQDETKLFIGAVDVATKHAES